MYLKLTNFNIIKYNLLVINAMRLFSLKLGNYVMTTLTVLNWYDYSELQVKSNVADSGKINEIKPCTDKSSSIM